MFLSPPWRANILFYKRHSTHPYHQICALRQHRQFPGISLNEISSSHDDAHFEKINSLIVEAEIARLEFWQILDALSDATWILDNKGELLRINQMPDVEVSTETHQACFQRRGAKSRNSSESRMIGFRLLGPLRIHRKRLVSMKILTRVVPVSIISLRVLSDTEV